MRSSSPKGDSAPKSASGSLKNDKAQKDSPYEAAKKAAQRSALNALKRARRAADKAGVQLSDWEDEFLGSVSDRVKTYGRAFADPEKGAPGQSLSAMQARKLKEIAKKAKGESRNPSPLAGEGGRRRRSDEG